MNTPQACRNEVLFQLYGAGGVPISGSHIRRVAKRQGDTFTDGDVQLALNYLTTHQPPLAQEKRDTSSGELRYIITADGQIAYQDQNPD